MLSVLEVGGRDNDGIANLGIIQFFVVAESLHVQVVLLFEVLHGLLAAQLPYVRDGHNLEIQLLGIGHEGGKQ